MKKFLAACLTIVFCCYAAPQLRLDRERIEAGKTFGLQLIFPLSELPENRGVPTFEAQNGFRVLALDSTDQVLRSDFDDFFGSFFGRSSRGREKVRIYTFQISAPKKTGKIDAGKLSIEIDGVKHVLTNSVPVNLQKSFADDALTVALTPSKRTVFQGEQFSVSIAFRTYAHFAGNLYSQSMDLGNDFIVHRAELNGLDFKPGKNPGESEANMRFAWLSSIRSGEMNIPPFSFKYSKRGEPKVVEENKSIRGMQISFSSTKQELEEAEALTAPVKIKVLPLPEGAPENFSGMVGNYSFEAQFDKTSLQVGEALTLNIIIKGDGTPGTIADPRLPDFKNFRTVPPETNISKKISGQKIITTKEFKIFLYPKHKGTFQIEEIAYSWFNPTKKKYESAKAGPWEITVEKNESPTSEESAPALENISPSKREIETFATDIRFIKDVPARPVGKKLYRSIPFWSFTLLPFPLYFIALFLWKRRKKNKNNLALMRNSAAGKNLNAALNRAEKAISADDSKAFFSALENALIGYLSDRTNLEFQGMVRQARLEALQKSGMPQNQIEMVEVWIEKCALARFSPASDMNGNKEMLKEFKKFISALEGLK